MAISFRFIFWILEEESAGFISHANKGHVLHRTHLNTRFGSRVICLFAFYYVPKFNLNRMKIPALYSAASG